jgi:hypothetical protein
MLNLNKNWWKILLLMLIATVIRAAGHMIDGTGLPMNIDPLSIFSKTLGLRTVLIIYCTAFYITMSLTFLIVEKWLSGSKTIKGLKFGIAWGIIFFLGVIETYPVFGKTALIADVRTGIADFISVVVLGVLLGKFLASDGRSGKTEIKSSSSPLRNNILIMLAVTSFYIIGRYFAYAILKIESGFIERPLATFIWTLATGISFGILYVLAGRNISENNLIKRTAFFGLINVGINWLVFNLFWPFVYQSSIARFAEFIYGRALVDTIFIMLGVYVSEWLINKQAAKITYSK